MIKNSVLILMTIILLNGCATWDGLKKDMSSIWEITQNKSKEAWVATKNTTNELLDLNQEEDNKNTQIKQ
jgi:uncharacterized protein YceK